MKKNFILFVALFMSLLVSGCTNPQVNRDLRRAGLSISKDKFECEEMFGGNEYTHGVIKYFNSSFAITTNSDLYEISLGQPFSNDKKCRKNETIKVDAIFNNYIVRDLNGKLFYLFDNEFGKKFTEVNYKTDKNSVVYKLFLNDRNILKVQAGNNENYYVLKKDGNIYNYTVVNENNYSRISKISKIYTKESYGGDIIDFFYDGEESAKTFIKTAHAYYRNIILNKELCDKYVDVKCEYEFGKDEKFTKNYETIIAFDGSTLVTDYLQIFTTGANADASKNVNE